MTNAIIVSILKSRYKDVYTEIVASNIDIPWTQEEINDLWNLCRQETDSTKLMIAVCLLLFSSDTIKSNVKVKRGLASAIALAKGTSQAAISNVVPAAVSWYSVYSEFRNRVDNIIKNYRDER